MKRLGLLGPASGDTAVFERALEHLFVHRGCDLVYYLGTCDVLEGAARARADALGLDTADGFEGRALSLARAGRPAEIDRFLEAKRALSRLAACRAIPLPPARTVEMLDDRLILLVYDKASLDEEDIANVDVVAYGAAHAPLVKKIGPRAFVTPGSVTAGHATVSLDESGALAVAAYDERGSALAEEVLTPRSARFSVAT